jgi:N-methylhydantoinase A
MTAGGTDAADRRYFLGVDVGGTFTDVVLGDSSGGLVVTKVTTTPDDPRLGVVAGIGEVLATHGVDPSRVTRVVHGTTLATNVILERQGSDIAFVTTAGFGDMLRLGRESRQDDDRFNLFFQTPPPPVPRARTFEIMERIDAGGTVVVALDPAEAADVGRRVAELGVRGVAICLMHAYAHPAHEAMVADACRAALPDDAFVITSSEVWPEMREYERAMTTVMCAYVGPVMAQYLAGLEARLAAMGIGCPIEIMESGGGVMSASLASRRPIYTVESGGAAGIIAAGAIGRLIGADQVLSFDMGGTTAKTGVVRHGRPDITYDFHVGGSDGSGGLRRGRGYPVKIPVVDLVEVGAGGGSIASVDAAGGLRVGPRSAGSVPGPACYGRGGTEPTVTDANLLLGYLRAGELSGDISLDPELSAKAIAAAVGGPLGLDVLAAAHAIHEVANATMAAAIRVVTVQRGIDPRDFTLVAFGGAGPLHAVELADTFGISRVVIPRAAGVASAIGLITSDLTTERVLTRVMPTDTAAPAVIAAVFEEIEAQAVNELPGGGEERGGGELVVSRSVEVRFVGQAHQLTVPAPSGPVTAASIVEITRAFVDRYRDVYGIELDAPTQFVNFRVRVARAVEKLAPLPHPDGVTTTPEPSGVRPVTFSGADLITCAIYSWDRLGPGCRVGGPAVIEGNDTTVVVPPDHVVETDRWWNLLIRPAPA